MAGLDSPLIGASPVPPNTLSSVIDILHNIVTGVGDAEIDALLREMEILARQEGREHEFEVFRQQADSVRRGLQDSAVAEKGLNLLIDTTHDLSKTLELDDLLRTIVSRARSLVGAHLAWVTVLDEKGGLFRMVTAEGNLSPAVAQMKSRPEVGVVSLIMRSKSYFETLDYLGDTRFRHSRELDRTFKDEKIVSLAGFPIISDNDVHGFLFVANRYSRKLSGREISVLGSFARHAGVAMRNANAFSRLSEALEEAQRSRNALEDHIKRVEASAAAHDEMTTLLATGAELHQFVQRMALQIGGAVFVFDGDMQLNDEFVSPGYRGKMANDLRDGSIDPSLLMTANSQSRHNGRSVVVLQTEEEQCRAIALHGSTGRSETLVLCHQGELDAIDIRNLERSTVALSIAKLWNEKRETERLIASSTLLRHLILVTPPDTATISAIHDRLGLAARQPIMLCLVAISNLERTTQTVIVRECAARASLLVDLFDDTYLVAGPEDAIRAFVQALAARQDGWSAGGMVSDPISDLTTTPIRFGELSRSLQAIRKLKPLRHFLDYRDVSFFARIMATDDSERLMRDISCILRPIDQLPPKQRTEAKRTLLAYFDAQHNATRTAAILGLHINTVRQRLDAIGDVVGGWDDPVKALELHFALRLEAIFEQPPV
jgi:GAF domain-containing protein